MDISVVIRRNVKLLPPAKQPAAGLAPRTVAGRDLTLD